jgi:outer membrane protein assembly factor BamB
MLRVTDGGGYLELWKGRAASPGEVAIMDGHLFAGDACYDVLTGRILGRLPGLGGTVACAYGLVYYLQNGPTVSLVDPSMGAMRLVGRFRPDGIGDRDLWVPPVIGEGRLFLRDRNRMSVFELRPEPESVGPRSSGGGRYSGPPPPIRWLPSENLLWRRQLPLTGLSSPVVHRGRVLMAGEPGAVVCCDAETGALEWIRDLNPKASRGKRKTCGAACEPIASGERLWARFSDGTVVCLGLDGTAIWQAAVAPSSNTMSSAALSDGILVLGGGDIVGLDAATGVERWRLLGQGQELDVVGKAWVRDRGVVISSAGQVVRSFDGTVIARDIPVAKAGCVVVEGMTVYAAVATAAGYTVEAYRLPQRAERGMPVRSLWKVGESIGVPVSLAVGEGRVLVATEDGALHVHDATKGGLVRSVEPTSSRPPSLGDRQLWMVGDRVYVGAPGSSGVVGVCRVETGEREWSFSTADPLVGMVFDGGRQFIRAGSVLHCIGGASPSKPSGPALVEPATDSWLRSRGRRPIVRVAPGEMPRFWLYSGPFAWRSGADPLHSLGGVAAARPAPGEDAADGGRNRRFAMLQDKNGRVSMDDAGGSRVMDFTMATDGVALPCSYYFFTTIENMAQRWFAYATSVAGRHRHDDGALRVRSWIGGKEVRSGDFVLLAAGRTALMVEVVIEGAVARGDSFVAPGFLEVESGTVESAQASQAAWNAYEATVSRTFLLQ